MYVRRLPKGRMGVFVRSRPYHLRVSARLQIHHSLRLTITLRKGEFGHPDSSSQTRRGVTKYSIVVQLESCWQGAGKVVGASERHGLVRAARVIVDPNLKSFPSLHGALATHRSSSRTKIGQYCDYCDSRTPATITKTNGWHSSAHRE